MATKYPPSPNFGHLSLLTHTKKHGLPNLVNLISLEFGPRNFGGRASEVEEQRAPNGEDRDKSTSTVIIQLVIVPIRFFLFFIQLTHPDNGIAVHSFRWDGIQRC